MSSETSRNPGVLNKHATTADTSINGIKSIGNTIINNNTTAIGFFKMLAVKDVVKMVIEITGSIFRKMLKT